MASLFKNCILLRHIAQPMNRFPAEFEALLNRKGRRLLNAATPHTVFLSKKETPVFVWNDIIDEPVSDGIIRLLDRYLYKELKDYSRPIPASLIRNQKKNYSEALPKTIKLLSAELNNTRSRSYEISGNIGLNDMLQSESFKRFGEAVTGRTTEPGPGMQVICYGAGDYSGPHNDHHPEEAHLRKGYMDIHLMFSNKYVRHQWLMVERNGFFNQQYDISQKAAVAVYKLPFWHATTPVIPVKGGEQKCRRWLILGSFIFK